MVTDLLTTFICLCFEFTKILKLNLTYSITGIVTALFEFIVLSTYKRVEYFFPFFLRWSTRLAPEAVSSHSATWMRWTALWSLSSMGRVQVCHRLPWTWSSCSISRMPLNAHVDHDTLSFGGKKTKTKLQLQAGCLFPAGAAPTHTGRTTFPLWGSWFRGIHDWMMVFC